MANIIIVVVVVIVIGLITLLIICVLGNLRLSKIISGVRHICNSTAFCLTLKIVLVKPIFSRYFRKFVVTTPSSEMTKGHIDMLLGFQTFLISRAKHS